MSKQLRKTGKAGVSQKQLQDLARWEKFQEDECGVYPAAMAAIKLRMTPQGVYQASQRGWLKFFSNGRDRWYSKKDVIGYRFNASKTFRDSRPLPPYPPAKGGSVTT